MQRVLVTGGSGFIGRHLIQELRRRGIEVRAWLRPSSNAGPLEEAGAEILRGDFGDQAALLAALRGVDTVFHLAGLTHALTPEQLDRVNGTVCGQLAEACLQCETPPRVLYVSSLSAAGPTQRGQVRTETDPPEPISDYGRSKRRGEIEFQCRADRLSCTVVRPGIVFGPHDPGTESLLGPIRSVGLHLVVGFKTPPLSMIYVDDLVRLILSAAEQGERLCGREDGRYDSQGYYFASDDREFPTYWELGKRFGSALGRPVFVWPLWRWVGRTVAHVATAIHRLRGKSGLLNVDKVREGTVESWAASSEKARRQLNFQPAQTLDEAFAETARWYK